MEHLSNSIADFYIRRKIIDPEDREVYKSGVELILNEGLTFLIVIICSFLMFRLRYALEFLAAFCFTRVFCGGFHAKKVCVCRSTMLLSFLLTVSLSYPLKNISVLTLLVILSASFAVVFRLAPVKHPNKRLTEAKRKENHKRSVISFVLFAAASILVFSLAVKQDGVIIALSLAAVAVLAAVGALLNGGGEKHDIL